MAGASRVRAVHLGAELPLEAPDASALSIHAVSVAVAIGNFAFVVSEGTLLALPAGVALAFPIDIFTLLAAQNWADT